MIFESSQRRGLVVRTVLGTILAGSAIPAMSQLTTATVRGSVSTADTANAGATISARNIDSGFTSRAVAGPGGAYVLPGLRPGTYDITFSADGKNTTRRVTVGVGQSSTLDVDLAPATTADAMIVVTGSRLIETRTSEIGTNVTTRQIEDLPQASRNFLNFADLAPGVRASKNENRKTFSAGGIGEDPNGESLASPQVNVFVDGVSLKSNIQQGGLVGGDSSRGNPFPQGAVQEFRVLSANYKAEYEDAGVSVITAVTKSGGNEFHGEAFGFFQNKDMREKDYFEKLENRPKGDFKRKQYGGSLGGPIIKDKLNFFVSYEGNDEDRLLNVRLGQRTPANIARFGSYEGTFASPFREDLGFAKLTFQPGDDDKVELSGSVRIEKETSGFGGATSQETASLNKNNVYTGNLRWQHNKGDFQNEASLDYVWYKFEPTSLNPDLVGQDFQGVIRIGGRDTTQRVVQKGLTLRDNVTLSNIDALGGNHVIKFGGKISFQNYQVNNNLNGNPLYQYRIDASQGLDFSFPFQALYGLGNPDVSAKDTQIGVFIQDDWEATDKLTFNLGLRWDYESNAKNNSYVTPADAVAALRGLEAVLAPQGSSFRADDYISTGSNRKPYTKAFQPRIGVSYDVFDDQRTVFFAGFGRYFDRTLFRNAAEESLFRQFTLRTFAFSRDGAPRDGQATIAWDPSYLTRAGLDGLIATNVAPNGELRVIRNDTRPPRTDQYSIGVRQKIGHIQTSLSYTHIEGRNQVGYFPANRSVARNADGFYDFIPVTGFGNVVALSEDRASRYDGVFLTIDKPYTAASPWALNIAYTLAFSKERGYSFNFDFPDIAGQPFRPNAGNERHRVVISGLVDLPWGLQASTLMTFASGQPYFVTDASQGFGGGLVLGNYGKADGFRQVDLRLAKNFYFRGNDGKGPRLQVIAEVFNVFNRANFGGYDGFVPKLPEVNANFGTPNSLNGPPRSFQIGGRFTF